MIASSSRLRTVERASLDARLVTRPLVHIGGPSIPFPRRARWGLQASHPSSSASPPTSSTWSARRGGGFLVESRRVAGLSPIDDIGGNSVAQRRPRWEGDVGDRRREERVFVSEHRHRAGPCRRWATATARSDARPAQREGCGGDGRRIAPPGTKRKPPGQAGFTPLHRRATRVCAIGAPRRRRHAETGRAGGTGRCTMAATPSVINSVGSKVVRCLSFGAPQAKPE